MRTLNVTALTALALTLAACEPQDLQQTDATTETSSAARSATLAPDTAYKACLPTEIAGVRLNWISTPGQTNLGFVQPGWRAEVATDADGQKVFAAVTAGLLTLPDGTSIADPLPTGYLQRGGVAWISSRVAAPRGYGHDAFEVSFAIANTTRLTLEAPCTVGEGLVWEAVKQ